VRLAREDLEDGVEGLLARRFVDVDEDERPEVVSDDERVAVELDDQLGLVGAGLGRLRARDAASDVLEVEARRVGVSVDRDDAGGQNIALKMGTSTSVPCVTP
jgi:hypothetical protein